MSTQEIIELIDLLKKYYPDAKCSLDFTTPFELAIAVMLSAQCTDERVNKTTPLLFSKYNTPKDFINLDLNELESIIHPCGFYKNKAKNIKAMSLMVENLYNGIIPKSMDELVKLPGIGRKSANVIMLDAFNNPQGIAIDTHAKRISNRLGLSDNTDPQKIEDDLIRIIPKKYFYDVNHLFVYHGRAICKAQNPDCSICPINKFCTYFKLQNNNCEL